MAVTVSPMAGEKAGNPAGKPTAKASGQGVEDRAQQRKEQRTEQDKKQHTEQGTEQQKDTLPLFTIGHSTRPIEEFIELLRSNGVRQLIDIRTIPKSRRNPQFTSDALAKSLHEAGIDY